ncbi:MAG TPA: site-specific integrase [Candidatus Dormibacteraeota bacterium]|jgi:integrase/recombinase XerD|nr:site-specific integrase [Candidatus Dormibacteraeota bacterium]
MNRTVNITKRVLTCKGLRYCPVIEANNGRVRPDYVMVDGKEERHPEGTYYLDWREGGKRVRRKVGKDAADAAAQRNNKVAALNATNHGVTVVPDAKHGRRSLASAISEYLAEVKLTKKHRSFLAYSTALQYFAESCPKTRNITDVCRNDMIRFAAFLRDEKEQSPRSCYNKFEITMGFLKGQEIRGIIGKNDWPRFVEEEPEIYEREDLDALYEACAAEERLWWDFFLMTGEREQEVIYTTWSDIKWTRNTVTVKHKPEYNWTPKAYKEREIPVPAKLIAALKTKKTKAGNCVLVFPTAGCKPKMDFLHCLKACARRAKLKQEDFWLHKFRATFATWSLWHPVDLRTVQQWLGHTDIESTMRYLKPSRSAEHWKRSTRYSPRSSFLIARVAPLRCWMS